MDKKPTDRGVVDSIRALREKRYMTRGPGAKLKTPSDTAKRVAMLQQLVDAMLAGDAPAPTPEIGELIAVLDEIRALRDENARLEKRLDRVELHGSLGTRPPSSATQM